MQLAPVFPITDGSTWNYALEDGTLVFAVNAGSAYYPFGNVGVLKVEKDLVLFDLEKKTSTRMENVTTYSTFSEGMLCFEDLSSGKTGFADRDGEVRIPARFDWARQFVGGICAASLDGETVGLLDRNGDWLIRPRFQRVLPHQVDSEYFAAFHEDEDWVIVDRSGNVISHPNCHAIRGPVDGYFPCLVECSDGTPRWGIADLESKIVVDPIFAEIGGDLSSGTLSGTIDGCHFGVIALDSSWIVNPSRYLFVGECRDGLRLFYEGGYRNADWQLEGGKFGFLDKEGSIAFAHRFDRAFDFDRGVAEVGDFLDDCPALAGDPCQEDHECRVGYLTNTGALVWSDRPSRRLPLGT